jgi:hypothetical protein
MCSVPDRPKQVGVDITSGLCDGMGIALDFRVAKGFILPGLCAEDGR